MIDYVVGGLVLLALALAARSVFRKKGLSCCSNCSKCPGCGRGTSSAKPKR